MPAPTYFKRYRMERELRLAGRMSRLGTETAFEVLERARALERDALPCEIRQTMQKRSLEHALSFDSRG